MFPKFAIAAPQRWEGSDNAKALAGQNALRFFAMGTRRGAAGVPPELTRLNPKIGLVTYVAARSMGLFAGESFRFRLHPWFDRWVKKQLVPGDHIISSFGYTNACFRWVRANGGKAFLSGGNSHPENFWSIMVEEHRRWGCADPPVARHHYERSCAMMADVDFILSPSRYVTQSFLERGFRPDQILSNVYPVDLANFRPSEKPRPRERPLTVISTGTLTLRKGTPYLLEAFRLVLREVPNARLMLTRNVFENVRPVLAKYAELPIDWAPALAHPQLADRLRSADIFVLPSLEEGLARTSIEALACGLPVIVTAHTGSNDMVESGVNGEVVPIRDAPATAAAILKWWERIRVGDGIPTEFDTDRVSYTRFEREFLRQLRELNLLPAA